MILEAIHNNKIIINDNNKSFVDTQSNKAFIKLFGNDADIFVLVHEFAHFIDINCNPHIIPSEYDFLCEVFSFYIEKQLELWLNDEKYNELIQARKNNRLYFESKMLNAIEYMLHCETTYKITGQLKLTDLDNEKVQTIMNYDYDLNTGFINYLLRYPLSNILSEYLINNLTIKNDYDICKICLNTNLYEILEIYYIMK